MFVIFAGKVEPPVIKKDWSAGSSTARNEARGPSHVAKSTVPRNANTCLLFRPDEEKTATERRSRAGSCGRLGAATRRRARKRLLTQRRGLICGIRAKTSGDKAKDWHCCVDPYSRSALLHRMIFCSDRRVLRVSSREPTD